MNEINFDIEELYKIQDQVLANLPQIPPYQPGRSIVTSCYRSEIPGMFVLLNEIARLGINLPIEIFYRANELNNDERGELAQVLPAQISFKQIQNDAKDFKDRWGNIKGWSVKVFAILESQYEENLWIDCDNVPIRNCEDLFEDSEYQQKGSVFWRDVYSIDRANQYCDTSIFWKIFRVAPNDGEPFESGQFLVNKSRVWPQLCLMMHYAQNCHIYFSFGGDAECWRMAWQHHAQRSNGYHSQFNYNAGADVPYGFMPFGPFHKGVANPWKKYGGGTVMVQRDRNGEELFNHRNLTKWNWNQNPFNQDIKNETNYHMIINHIKSKYVKSNA
jgi:hypothetical protein